MDGNGNTASPNGQQKPAPQGRRKFDESYKVLSVGEKDVGKTCLIKRFCDNEFAGDCSLTTIGTELRNHYKELNNKQMKITLVDTAGQERFAAVTSNYYRGANVILFVYDCTNDKAFRKVENWFRTVND